MNFKLAIAAFFTFTFSMFKFVKFIGKAKEDEIRADAQEEAREYEKAMGEAESKGLQRESKLADKGVATDKPDPFKWNNLESLFALRVGTNLKGLMGRRPSAKNAATFMLSG